MNLLPSDKYLASVLGLSDEDYAWFKAEVKKHSLEAPKPAVVAGIDPVTLSIISLVIGIGSTVVSSLLRPKPRFDQDAPGRAPEIRTSDFGGQRSTLNQRFAPRYGFNATQEISTLGSTIPLVYAKKETISGVPYGGVRVATQLLWSQIYSLGGSQMLRAIFLVGEGPIAEIEPQNFASGGNTLISYDFGSTANPIGSRMTVYGRYDSGLTTRIQSSDQIYGRQASEDPGNASSSNVYAVQVGSSLTSDFCAAEKPANQTVFGLYGFCGNDFSYRINPTFEPIVRPQLVPYKKDGETKVKCITDESKWAIRRKQQVVYSSRSGITSQNMGTIGGQTTYNLYTSSDKNTAFSRAIRDIFTISDWTISKELIVDTAGTTVDLEDTSAGGQGKVKVKYNDTNNRNSTIDAGLEESLLNRFTPTIKEISEGPGVTPGGVNDWGHVAYSDNRDNTGAKEEDIAAIAVKVEFNTTSPAMSLAEIQLLKASKFKVTLTNDLVADDPEDDITVTQTHQLTATSDSAIELSTTAVSHNFYVDNSVTTTNIDGVTVVTDVNSTLQGNLQNTQKVTSQDALDVTYQWSRVPANDTANYYTLVSYINLKDVFAETCEDVASSIAGRQKSWDNSIVLGELYKIGSGLAVCTSRTASPFASTADEATPQSVTATFKTVRTGAVQANTQANIELDGDDWYDSDPPPPRNTATTDGHIMRCAIAAFSTSRPCNAVEIGIRSRLGIRVNGIASFNTLKNNKFCDNKACLDFKGNILDEGTSLYTNNYRSNTVSTQVERYSFFKIYYREAGASSFTELQYSYGMRGSTSENIFNYLQIYFGSNAKTWEFQLEPLSGWEVREYRSASQLYVLEAGLPAQVITDSGLTLRFNGTSVPGTADTFAISVGRRSTSLDTAEEPFNYPLSDADYSNGDRSLIDTWGKLAESFIFDEVVSSATAPEHEVTYVNEIVTNSTAPNYDNLSLIGVNISSSVEWQQFSQFSCYVTGGKTCRQLRSSLAVGATHLFPDIALDLMTNSTYGRGDLISDGMIDLVSFEDAADWCYSRKYFFDGVVADKLNIRQWCADIAATHLLIFGESDGKFFLKPALQFNAVDIAGLFTAGNIVEGSFKLQYFDPEDREPVQISVRYREERASTDLTNPGMFPTVREVLVRESAASSTVVLETVDMSDYCTSRDHAIDAAKFVIRMRRIPTHTVTFTTTHEGVLMAMAPSDYIKVAMDATEYDEFNNGIVTPEGALVSTKALTDGTYSVIAWNGDSNTDPASTTLTVSNSGKTATPTGVVFTVELPATQVRTYQIERITPTEEGAYTIEAIHMPTNSSGVLEIADGFDTAGNWTIS